MRFLSVFLLVSAMVNADVITTTTSTNITTPTSASILPTTLPTSTSSSSLSSSSSSLSLSACSEADNRVLLFKDNSPNSYKLVFENLNQNARPSWIDVHYHTPSTGSRTVRIVSNGMTSNVAEHKDIKLNSGESLIQHVSYGDALNNTKCATKTMMYTRDLENEFSTMADINAPLFANNNNPNALNTNVNTNTNTYTNTNSNTVTSTLPRASTSNTAPVVSPTSSVPVSNVNVPFRRTECPAVQLGRKIVLSSLNAENTYKLMFDIPSSLWKVDFIELHYKINEQPLKDIRLGNEVRGGSTVEQDGIVIRPRDNITYFATYAVDGAPCVTHTYIDTLEA